MNKLENFITDSFTLSHAAQTITDNKKKLQKVNLFEDVETTEDGLLIMDAFKKLDYAEKLIDLARTKINQVKTFREG